jgi:hypothetical protein
MKITMTMAMIKMMETNNKHPIIAMIRTTPKQ